MQSIHQILKTWADLCSAVWVESTGKLNAGFLPYCRRWWGVYATADIMVKSRAAHLFEVPWVWRTCFPSCSRLGTPASCRRCCERSAGPSRSSPRLSGRRWGPGRRCPSSDIPGRWAAGSRWCPACSSRSCSRTRFSGSRTASHCCVPGSGSPLSGSPGPPFLWPCQSDPKRTARAETSLSFKHMVGKRKTPDLPSRNSTKSSLKLRNRVGTARLRRIMSTDTPHGYSGCRALIYSALHTSLKLTPSSQDWCKPLKDSHLCPPVFRYDCRNVKMLLPQPAADTMTYKMMRYAVAFNHKHVASVA